MWADALRIVKEYIPSRLDEFQKEMAAKSGKYVSQLCHCYRYTYPMFPVTGTMRSCCLKALCGSRMESILMP